MLEDELTSILLDDEIKQLVVTDGEEAQGLSRKLRSQNRPFLLTDFEEGYDLVKRHRGEIKPAEPSAKSTAFQPTASPASHRRPCCSCPRFAIEAPCR